MRFLADENVPGPVVRRLRELGHDVEWVKEYLAGETDRALLSLAQTERRVVITCDKDFGELAFGFGLPAESGVVLLRIPWTAPVTDDAFVVSTLTSRDDWSGVFAVVERDRIRLRPLPKGTSADDAG